MNSEDYSKEAYENYVHALNYYKSISADFFKESTEPIALHHKNLKLHRQNKERYDEWRISDVIPMKRSEHCKLHAKGLPWSEEERNLRKSNMKRTIHN